MKKVAKRKKKQKLYKNYFPNANFLLAEKYLEKCLHLLFGRFELDKIKIILSFDKLGHVVEMFHGIKQCVPVRLMMYLIKLLLINLLIDRN
jgi:hypothetical protein